MSNKNSVTTLKLEKETKDRLEKLREHKRETYDDIIRKIMYVLNTVRDEPVKARAILEFIDEKRKRMFETEFHKQEKPSSSIPAKTPRTPPKPKEYTERKK